MKELSYFPYGRKFQNDARWMCVCVFSSISSIRLYTSGVKATLHQGSRSPALDVGPTIAGPSF